MSSEESAEIIQMGRGLGSVMWLLPVMGICHFPRMLIG